MALQRCKHTKAIRLMDMKQYLKDTVPDIENPDEVDTIFSPKSQNPWIRIR